MSFGVAGRKNPSRGSDGFFLNLIFTPNPMVDDLKMSKITFLL